MNKNLIIILLLLLSLFSAGCSGSNKPGDGKAEKLSYDIIEKEDLSNNTLKDWYERSYKEFGYHYTSDDKGNRYVLISAGERPSGGYELVLESVGEEAEKITFIAELRYPEEDQAVTQALTYPHLLIKSDFDKEITAEMKNVEEQHLNLTGSYIGRIDNNSVEIDLESAAFGREGIQALRLNDETRNWFDTNNLITNTRIKFDVLKNRDGQLIITKIKASGDEVEEVIIGYFIGLADNNFVETEIDGETKVYKLCSEFSKNLDVEMYENKKVAMLCVKDKTYEYIVLDMKPIE